MTEKKLPVKETETEIEESGGCPVVEHMGVRSCREASDQHIKYSREASMSSEKSDCRRPRRERRWGDRDREMSEGSGWELKVK